MPLFLLSEDLFFPDPNESLPDGLLAVGGELSVDRLLLAYEKGIFPWYNPEDPILWWSPNPRCFLFHSNLKISKSMRNIRNRNQFKVTFDWDFDQVIRSCQRAPRKDQEGTWITNDIIQAYTSLHELGVAHSVEVWEGEELVGGLYGVSLGNMFFGESMFSKKSNTSKLAFITLSEALHSKGFVGIDCQIMNDHLASMGATDIPRDQFLKSLNKSLLEPTLKGSWSDLLAT